MSIIVRSLNAQVLVDTAYLDAHLPHSIEAFVDFDRAAYRQFLEHYGVEPSAHPLVTFIEGDSDGMPFREPWY